MHIILIGFKHVGKTMLGKQLAPLLKRKFIDLDQEMEKTLKMSCREIMIKESETGLREIENFFLKKIITKPSALIALGGGTPLHVPNQTLIQKHFVMHVTAEPEIVFNRIMQAERPPFFDPTKDDWDAFNALWQARMPVYRQLANFLLKQANR